MGLSPTLPRSLNAMATTGRATTYEMHAQIRGGVTLGTNFDDLFHWDRRDNDLCYGPLRTPMAERINEEAVPFSSEAFQHTLFAGQLRNIQRRVQVPRMPSPASVLPFIVVADRGCHSQIPLERLG